MNGEILNNNKYVQLDTPEWEYLNLSEVKRAERRTIQNYFRENHLNTSLIDKNENLITKTLKEMERNELSNLYTGIKYMKIYLNPKYVTFLDISECNLYDKETILQRIKHFEDYIFYGMDRDFIYIHRYLEKKLLDFWKKMFPEACIYSCANTVVTTKDNRKYEKFNKKIRKFKNILQKVVSSVSNQLKNDSNYVFVKEDQKIFDVDKYIDEKFN
jgi:hypothetical protein